MCALKKLKRVNFALGGLSIRAIIHLKRLRISVCQIMYQKNEFMQYHLHETKKLIRTIKGAGMKIKMVTVPKAPFFAIIPFGKLTLSIQFLREIIRNPQGNKGG